MRTIATISVLVTGLATLGHSQDPANYDRESDPHGFNVFMEEGGWCWYQDPRAILHGDTLYVGGVRGNGNGEATVGLFDVSLGKRLGSVTVHPDFDKDDHNSPVFHVRPDGSVLTVYAKHNRDRFHYLRFSAPDNPLKWSDQIRHERDMPSPSDRITYMNLCELKDEGKLYLFFRGINFNPSFVTSEDQGKTWSGTVHFFRDELEGRHRPYARYACNGKDTVYVSITDGHPRNYGNGIYYFEYRNGRFYRADGSLIGDLMADGPLRPSEAELVYKGTGNPGRGNTLSAIGAAWTSDIKIDRNGHPHIAYTVYNSNADNRYRIASWNGKRWIDREVARGGRCLYDREASYTGLISLDPVDPTMVVISTDVDPTTGEYEGGRHEIYRAMIGPDDSADSIDWNPITKDSPVKNLRPLIIRDHDRRVILWNRGDFKTYTNYQLDTVGIVESVAN